MTYFALNRNKLQNLGVRQFSVSVCIDVPCIVADYYTAQSPATYCYWNRRFHQTFSIIRCGKQQPLLFAAWDEKLSGTVADKAGTFKKARESIKLNAMWCNEKFTRHGDLRCIICPLLFKSVCGPSHFVSEI